ncbi:MAG: phosphatidate cytidylyltransferase [Desulfofustis sp.]|jgi:phosphatidate cytidylyltransferase|nr:phosphatidate cytidylyltransferase [Desulfofustis sp.]
MNRIVPGVLLALFWLLLLAKGSFQLFWAVVVIIGFIGAREYCRMAFAGMLYESDRVLLPMVMISPILAAVFSVRYPATHSFGLLLGLVGVAGYVFGYYTRLDRPVKILSRGVLGLAYVGFLLSHLVLVRGLDGGGYWLIILAGITAGSDTGAYWVGSRWGRRKLCPNISPNKTVEGALGGLAGGLIGGILLSLFFPVSAPFLMIVTLAAVLAAVGMTGDLIESVMKRGYGVKDSGSLLGGHGGVLDRIDSLLLAGPFLYYMLMYTGF